MLQLKDLRKQYKTADLVQNALDGVSINLRDQEFVAILGPSGSGKTTLLNVIGGLDRYDSGDLIINGVSTKKYKDRDWDTYRNHSIGFVFQSYNLIQHQTILANVELALTIAGASVKERRKLAKEALEKVGLGAQINKRPSQLSGGQMQRVAIARALVNNPDILLADEPTGALDSETSVQVMELLKEVAQDRLVVMVTHNPELADAYATRIVRIKDGKVIDDSDPFDPEKETADAGAAGIAGGAAAGAAGIAAASQEDKMPDDQFFGKQTSAKNPRRKKKASMSFLTALSLSFNNLRTKKARTALVAIAGSIGLIGIALIQALSNGANDYIDQIEETTVLSYPVSMYKTGINMSTYMSMFEDLQSAKDSGEDDIVTVNQVMHKSASGLTSNDLESVNTYLLEETDIDDYVKAIEYTYDVTPQVYRINGDKIRRVDPEESIETLGMGMTYETLSTMGLSGFSTLPANEGLYKDQYEVEAGHWPENSEECVLVLGDDGSVKDITLYTLGLKSTDEMEQIEKDMMNGVTVTLDENPGTYTYDDFLGISFKVINSCDYYVYSEENGFWVDKTSDEEYLKELYDNGRDLTVVGIVRAKEDADGSLSSGLYYTSDLVTELIEEAAESDVVKAQLANRSTNILTGKEFGEQSSINDLDFGSLLSVDEDAIKNAFSVNTDALSDLDFSSMMTDGLDLSSFDFSSLDLSSMVDLSDLNFSFDISDETIAQLFQSITFNASADDIKAFMTDLVSGYMQSEGATDFLNSIDLFNLLSGYIQSEEAAAILNNFVAQVVTNVMENTFIDPNEIIEKYQNMDPSEIGTIALSDIIDMDALMNLISLTGDQLEALGHDLASGFLSYAQNAAAPDIERMMQSFADYLGSDEVKQKITDFVSESINIDDLRQQASALAGEMAEEMQTQISGVISSLISGVSEQFAAQIGSQISSMMESVMESMTSQFSDNMENVFSIDEDAMQKAFTLNMSEESIKEFIMSMSTTASETYENNLADMGYADIDDPESILIYSKDFDSKTAVLNILSDYNEKMTAADEDDKVVTYSDIAGTLMSSVSSIINVVSTVLIALVAISLVVSSIMIGVITYISVLERKKEIGILRALGASKGNVSNVFNAETFITGLLAGLLGISVALVLVFLANIVIHDVMNEPDISAFLDPGSAVFLVILSIVLNIIAGFLPSRKAANSNPVTALRDD